MKKPFLLIIASCCILHAAFPQNPLVKQWDKRFGGTDHDGLYAIFQQTADGGFILGGESYSDSSGDKTQHNWDPTFQTADFWIVKTDNIGMKQWDKRFGGTGDDYLLSVQQTTDGGYILGGASASDSSGDKTQPVWGFYDYWIVKTDSLGNKQWDKRYGGTGQEELSSLAQTADGGYILAGYSYSDSSGDKTQYNWGQDDYWVVKVDSLGSKQWDYRYGGASYDEPYIVQQTTDGGYIIGGYSGSGGTGDATQPSQGGWDYWIIKIDTAGIKQWDKRFGGTGDDILYSLQQTIDHGYILAGCSRSDSTGDKTGHNWDPTLLTYDFWIIKIDSLGGYKWDKDFGAAADEDVFGNVSQTADNGYLLVGTTYSNAGGNKTENNLGLEQTWVLKTDSLGNLQWEKTIFTDGHDETGYGVQTTDGCYVMATETNGGIAGYKSEPNWDATLATYDYWIVKFCDTTATDQIGEVVQRSMFNVYPNPANDFIVISAGAELKGKMEITITDITGKQLFQSRLPSSVFHLPAKIDISFFSPGIYFIKTGNEVKKFIKE